MPPNTALSYDHCRTVARRGSSSFFRAMRLTPEPKRSALFTVYAWMRRADDLADGPEACRCPDAALERLETFSSDTQAALDPARPLPPGDLWPAFRDTVGRCGIPADYLQSMIEGQRRDLQPVTIQTFDDLYAYCYRVASVVGLTCVKVWGDDGDPRVAALAEARGVALQLTNILRDLREDATRGRVYLPQDDLERFGVSADDLRQGRVSESFLALMRFQIDRARSYYDKSAGLERHLTADCRATSWAMMRTYRVLLERIAADPARVLTQRVSLSLPRKLAVVAGAVAKRSF